MGGEPAGMSYGMDPVANGIKPAWRGSLAYPIYSTLSTLSYLLYPFLSYLLYPIFSILSYTVVARDIPYDWAAARYDRRGRTMPNISSIWKSAAFSNGGR